jgi:hypothetical protein
MLQWFLDKFAERRIQDVVDTNRARSCKREVAAVRDGAIDLSTLITGSDRVRQGTQFVQSNARDVLKGTIHLGKLDCIWNRLLAVEQRRIFWVVTDRRTINSVETNRP